MAKLVVLAVFDSAVSAFNRPFFTPARGAGIRAFMDECVRRDKDNPMFNHPQDFSLFQLGTWDEESAQFEQNSVPERIALASDFCTSEE